MGRSLVFDYMNKDEVQAHIEVNYETGEVICIEYCDVVHFQFLGLMPKTIESVLTVMETMCIPRGRQDVDEILGMMGLKEYNPVEILRHTHGHTMSNNRWIRFEGETIKWSDVNVLRPN